MTLQKQKSHRTALRFTNDDARWDAIVRRDRAADGAFYYSVRTTGVYCRPSCGARRPRREHVRFHASAADAERAGFRPCKRCRPQERPLEEQRADVVAQACRQIEASNEPVDLDTLAGAAGMSRFHFHRVFKAVAGVTPRAYAEARRAGRIRDELARAPTVDQAAAEAGFPSNGHFHTVSSALLGMTPGTFRNGAAGIAIRHALGRCWLGAILVAATERGVCAVLLGDDADALVGDLRNRFPHAHFIPGDASFEQLVAQAIACVETPSAAHDLPLDIQGTAFQRQVWQALRMIPAGSTATYTEIAQRIGQPSAVRAVATACAVNPVAVAVPCHRVVRTDGSLSGYRWGVDRKARLLAREAAGAPVPVPLHYTPPLDWALLLRHLRNRATAGVEVVDDACYSRTIELDGALGILTVTHHPTEPRLELTVQGPAASHAPALAARVRRMFDLDADLAAIHAALGRDPWLAPLVQATPGLRLPGAWSPFELIARTIAGQQVTVKAATTIMGRIAQRAGRSVPETAPGAPALLFPTPQAVAGANLEAIGMPSPRVAALQSVARAFADGAIPFPDSGARIEDTKGALLALPGIGPWTVEYFAMRALRDLDAWPVGDLALRRALAEFGPDLTPAALLARTERWRPWRAYAAMHLWNRNPPPPRS